MRICATCSKERADKAFRKDARYSDGLSPICDRCRSNKTLSDAAALTKLLAGVDDRDRLGLIERVFGALPTIDIDAVPILAAGGPYFGTGSPPGGDFFTKADLEQIAEDTNKLEQAGDLRPPSKLGHSEEQRLLNNSGLPVGDELPAAGWLTNFRVSEIGGVWKLLADVKSVPAKLGQILSSGGYRTRSVELSRVTSGGVTYEGVVTGMAWLGAKAPAVRNLDDVWNLYADKPRRTRSLAVGDVVWEEENGVMDLLSDLTAAINQEVAPDEPSYMWELWVNDVNLALNTCTASDWDGDTTWIIGFKIDAATNEPTVDSRDAWVPSTMKLVEIDLADADPIGAGGGAAMDDGEYSDRSAARRYIDQRRAARSSFLLRAADTKSVKLTDEQVATLAKTFNLDGEGDELRTKVEDHLKSLTATDEVKPEPVPAAPVKPAAETAVALSSFSEEQRAELTPLLETLTERAERGDRAFAQHFAETRDGKIQKALTDCRLNPADRAEWVTFYNESPDLASKMLEQLPVNPVLVVTFGVDEDGLSLEQADTRDKAVEDAYLVATGVTDAAPMGGSDA